MERVASCGSFCGGEEQETGEKVIKRGKNKREGCRDEQEEAVRFKRLQGQSTNHTWNHPEYSLMEENTEPEVVECNLSNDGATATVDDLTKSMKDELASKPYKPDDQATILRVPDEMRNDDPGAYIPKVVSIGPFHRSRQNVQHMEELKWHYLGKFLDRKPENGLQMYVQKMKEIEERARSCYKGNIEMESEEFVKMMVLDGCFIIQLLLQLDDGFLFHREDGFAPEDPIYCDRWTLPRVAHDMLLLENQLPFCVLEKLWVLTRDCPWDLYSLKKSVLNFFRNLLPEEHDLDLPCIEVHHILHLLHSSVRTKPPSEDSHLTIDPHDRRSPMSEHKPPPPPKTIPTVTALQEAGVKFKRKKAKSFLDIEFKQGLMEIPRLTISDTTNSLFRNFIAFEQCLPWSSAHFTSYCIFMDSLINTPRDVQLLYQSDIIEHVLGRDEEVANLFNKFCKGITWDYKNSYLAHVSEDVIKHSQRKWPKWRAKLVRDYFSNPWAILSLAAAIFVIILTSGQTFFAVFAYFRPPPS